MVATPKKTVLIADDHTLLAEGIAGILAAAFHVVAIVRDGRQLVADAPRLRPDLIVLDISMPELNGIEAIRHLHPLLPDTRFLVVTQQADQQYLRAAIAAGASGYILKQSAAGELLTALRRILQGGSYITPQLERQIGFAPITELRRDEPHHGTLTVRQREVLQLIAEGRTAREIASSLGISSKTVEFHKKSLMDQTGLRTTAELTRYAVLHGIVFL